MKIKVRRLSQTGTLAVYAAALLLLVGALSAWLGQQVLDPVRFVDLHAKGSSILATPRAFFKTPSIGGKVGQAIAIPVSMDTNGGDLSTISAEIRYSPLDMSMTLGETEKGICNAYTKLEHDTVSGIFTVTCTAPTTGGSQVSPFLTFIATPLREGGLPITLVGRSSDYAVLTIQ
jgi:hypothetical protein